MNKNTRKNKKSAFKTWVKKLHLWFGLGIGFIVFVVSITGALYVFKEDIQAYLRKDFICHHEQNITDKKTLPLKVLERKVNEQTNEKYPVHWAEIPLDKTKSYKFYYYETNSEAWNYFDELVVYKCAYVNPFSGEVLSVQDEKNGFFNIVKFIHWSFLLKSTWGKYVVGIPVLIFLLMLISGIILWWPKNKKARKQRFWFRWGNIKNWRRKNYDLHSILGFYASFVALIVAITGLFYAFMFIQTALYWVFSGGETAYPDFSHKATTAPVEMKTDETLDKIAYQVEQLYPNESAYSFDFGHDHLEEEPIEETNFMVYVRGYDDVYYKYSEMIFDENSGELLLNRPYAERNMGEKYIAANYDIHVGAILGVFGKILALICSLICASLPITGFLVWWGRNHKRKKI